MSLYTLRYQLSDVRMTEDFQDSFEAADDAAAVASANGVTPARATNVKLFLTGTDVTL